MLKGPLVLWEIGCFAFDQWSEIVILLRMWANIAGLVTLAVLCGLGSIFYCGLEDVRRNWTFYAGAYAVMGPLRGGCCGERTGTETVLLGPSLSSPQSDWALSSSSATSFSDGCSIPNSRYSMPLSTSAGSWVLGRHSLFVPV
jgi:hypothetical protein